MTDLKTWQETANADQMPLGPRDPAAGPPARRPGSVRRTSTLLSTWPRGRGTRLHMQGRARDLLTPVEGDPVVLRHDDVVMDLDDDRRILSITSIPLRPGIEVLVGARGGGHLRGALAQALPAEVEEGTPLHLLIDDVAGGSLVAGFAWSRHTPDWMVQPNPSPEAPDAVGTPTGRAVPEPARRGAIRRMEGICAGFRPGSSALQRDGTHNPTRPHNVWPVPTLDDPDDPWSWHALHAVPAVAMRRSRRIDVWREGDIITVDAMFRDSCWEPDGTEIAIHEYSIDATVDEGTGLVEMVAAQPRVLPFAECPAAAPNAAWLAGATARNLRTEVLERIQRTDCCTHLNDALRSLAEVPVLAALLPAH